MSDDASSVHLSYWPGSWPGQQVAELVNPGDPGFWLEERLAEIEVTLGGDDADLENTATLLTDDSIAAAARMSFPPSFRFWSRRRRVPGENPERVSNIPARMEAKHREGIQQMTATKSLHQSRPIATLPDALLPMLRSGELSVSAPIDIK